MWWLPGLACVSSAEDQMTHWVSLGADILLGNAAGVGAAPHSRWA